MNSHTAQQRLRLPGQLGGSRVAMSLAISWVIITTGCVRNAPVDHSSPHALIASTQDAIRDQKYEAVVDAWHPALQPVVRDVVHLQLKLRKLGAPDDRFFLSILERRLLTGHPIEVHNDGADKTYIAATAGSLPVLLLKVGSRWYFCGNENTIADEKRVFIITREALRQELVRARVAPQAD